MRDWTRELLNGYIDHPAVTTDAIDEYITPSSFGDRAGMVGCLTLAYVAYEEAGGRGAGAGSATATSVGGGCPAKRGSFCCVYSAALHVAVAAGLMGLGALVFAKSRK